MKNKLVGILVISIAALMGFIIWSFNSAMKNIVNESCDHGQSCPMWGHINFQTNVSIGIMVFVVILGTYLIFFSTEEKIITKIKRIKPKTKKPAFEKAKNIMDEEEKTIFNLLLESKGTMFQSEIVEKTNQSKVKISRILDRLEGKNFIERRRRGLTNVVILKHND